MVKPKPSAVGLASVTTDPPTGQYWQVVATVRPDGKPHVMPVLAVWLDSALYFVAGPASRKARNLARNAHCVLTVAVEDAHLVVEGEAVKVSDDATLHRVAGVYASKYAWHVTVRDGANHVVFESGALHPDGSIEGNDNDADPKRFDLVLTDEMMPDLTGTELAREIRQLRPEISIILMSGYGGAQLSERAQAAGVIDVLRKPLIRRDIAEPVARALQARCN